MKSRTSRPRRQKPRSGRLLALRWSLWLADEAGYLYACYIGTWIRLDVRRALRVARRHEGRLIIVQEVDEP